MGIQGLLPLLKPITCNVHVRDLAGLTIGVDAYVWLHRGAYACADELCQGKDTGKYLNVCFERMRLLLDHGVKLYIVFDGGPLRAKRGTEHERRARRDANRQKALQCLDQRRTSEAFQYFSKAVDVTPAMAYRWIKTIRNIPNVSYVVAPYEADAQLAYLNRTGIIDGVITEDSDILAFGCSRVLFKLEPTTGYCQQILHADLFRQPIDSSLDLRTWDEESFLAMCILSGCDYLPSVPGLGLRSAYRLIQRHKTAIKAIRAMRFEAKLTVPQDYEERFQEAFYTFRHQRVFDPRQRIIVHLHTLVQAFVNVPPDQTEYLGAPIDAEIAAAIADGDMDPNTKERFEAPVIQVQSKISTYVKNTPATATSSSSSTSSSSTSVAIASSNAHNIPPPPVLPPPSAAAMAPRPLIEQRQQQQKQQPTFIYRPGLRKTSAPSQPNRITAYLKKACSSSTPKSKASRTANQSSTGRIPLGQVKASRTLGVSIAVTNGEGQARHIKQGGGDACDSNSTAMQQDPVDAAKSGSSCLPQLSGWFCPSAGGAAASTTSTSSFKSDKENNPQLPSLASSFRPLPTTTRAATVPPSAKRQRTLGGRSTSYSIKKFAMRAVGLISTTTTPSMEEEQETDSVLASPSSSASTRQPSFLVPPPFFTSYAGGGYDDDLQPPTPDTPSIGRDLQQQQQMWDREEEEGLVKEAGTGGMKMSMMEEEEEEVVAEGKGGGGLALSASSQGGRVESVSQVSNKSDGATSSCYTYTQSTATFAHLSYTGEETFLQFDYDENGGSVEEPIRPSPSAANGSSGRQTKTRGGGGGSLPSAAAAFTVSSHSSSSSGGSSDNNKRKIGSGHGGSFGKASLKGGSSGGGGGRGGGGGGQRTLPFGRAIGSSTVSNRMVGKSEQEHEDEEDVATTAAAITTGIISSAASASSSSSATVRRTAGSNLDAFRFQPEV